MLSNGDYNKFDKSNRFRKLIRNLPVKEAFGGFRQITYKPFQALSIKPDLLSRLFFTLIFGLLFLSCSTPGFNSRNDETGIRLVNGKPFWFFNPNKDGKPGGVGVSGRHVRGRSAQRELAIHRAINDLARQMNVKVDSVVTSSSASSAGGASSELNSYSIQTVNGQLVRARVIEFWEDRQTDELYVWMVLQ